MSNDTPDTADAVETPEVVITETPIEVVEERPISERTRLEMEAGRKALAEHAASLATG